MSDRDDHYAALGVTPDASQVTIKKAYLELIRRHHPDRLAAAYSRARASGDAQRRQTLQDAIDRATQTSRQINTAYHVLSNPERRQRYDASRQKPVPAPPPPIDPEDERLTISQRRRIHRAQREAILREREKQKQSAPRPRPGAAAPASAPEVSSASPLAYAAVFIASAAILGLVIAGLTGGSAPEEEVVRQRVLAGTAHAIESTVVGLRSDQVQITPSSLTPDPHLEKGDQYYSITNYDEAVKSYTMSINRNPDSALRYYRRGLARRAPVDVDADALRAAIADFSRTLELDASFIMAYRARGLTYLELWAQTNDDAYRGSALRDLQDYFTRDGRSDDEIEMLIASLSAATAVE